MHHERLIYLHGDFGTKVVLPPHVKLMGLPQQRAWLRANDALPAIVGGMPFAQYSEQAILGGMFGGVDGCVRTIITAGAASQTAIATGSFATGGVSGNMDTTPGATEWVFTGTPGTGATQNQYTNPATFQLTGAAATTLTIASQSVGLARAVGDFVIGFGPAAAPAPLFTWNTLYIGVTTQTVAGATQANVLSGEPTSTGSYARIVVANTATNWNAATAAQPSVTSNAAVFNFPQSTTNWSTTTNNLIQAFIADAPTLAGGNVIAYGALGTPQAINAANITLSLTPATTGVTISLT